MPDLLEELQRPAKDEDQWHRVVSHALFHWRWHERVELAEHLDSLGSVRLRLLSSIARDATTFPLCAWPRSFS
jgi:hypothetical protein